MADAASLDQELEALHHAVAMARRNRWHGGDTIQPEFERFLSALGRSTSTTEAELDPGPAWRTRRNSWREAPGIS
jgi:hypothetical protein